MTSFNPFLNLLFGKIAKTLKKKFFAIKIYPTFLIFQQVSALAAGDKFAANIIKQGGTFVKTRKRHFCQAFNRLLPGK